MAISSTVHPVRFAIPSQIQLQAGPLFDSDNVGFNSGQIQSNVNWSTPLWEYNLRYVKTNADFMAIQSFFLARQGMGYGFFLFDPVDYTDDGAGSVKLVGSDYRLVKEYPDDYNPTYRLIRRPVEGTVDISAVPGTGKTIDYATGIVTGTGIGEGVATYEFDVPVKFMTNACMPTYQPHEHGREIVDWVDVRLRELRNYTIAS